jgi:hypothetical protein
MEGNNAHKRRHHQLWPKAEQDFHLERTRHPFPPGLEEHIVLAELHCRHCNTSMSPMQSRSTSTTITTVNTTTPTGATQPTPQPRGPGATFAALITPHQLLNHHNTTED